ncbi:MAG: Arc family DNA-binding protein [Rhizomicrobium sp.]
MPITLSIRNVPDEVAERLRVQAARNHRSLQGELMALLAKSAEEGFQDEGRKFMPQNSERKMTVREIADEIRRLGLPQLPENESTQMIREDRDNR